MHPATSEFLKASGKGDIVAKMYFPDQDIVQSLLGEGFQATPIPIEADNTLDTKTVAVRFKINSSEYADEMKSFIFNVIAALRDRDRSREEIDLEN